MVTSYQCSWLKLSRYSVSCFKLLFTRWNLYYNSKFGNKHPPHHQPCIPCCPGHPGSVTCQTVTRPGTGSHTPPHRRCHVRQRCRGNPVVDHHRQAGSPGTGVCGSSHLPWMIRKWSLSRVSTVYQTTMKQKPKGIRFTWL